jgi:dipeptidyl aminopeptidase/acylaminoacyl peptidase
MKKRTITAEDLLRMKFIRSIRLSPDESRVMFTVEVMSEDKKKYHSHIYMINVDGSDLRQYTFGDVSDSNPIFSSDGKWIVFTSKRGEKKGLYKMPTAGGEAKLLIEADGSFSDISTSPDSKQILCVFRKADEAPKDKDGKKEAPVFRHITRKFYKLDNAGFLPQDRGHVFLYDIENGKGRKIANTRNGERQPVWFPDGKKIAYITNLHRDPDEEPLRDEIFILPIAGGKGRMLEKPAGPADGISISPDGKFIAYLGHTEPHDPWGVAPYHVWKVPATGGKPVDLTPDLDHHAIDETISDTAEEHDLIRPAWSKDGRWLHFIVSSHGSTNYVKVSSTGGKSENVIGGKVHVMAASYGPRKGVVAIAISNPVTPAEIFVANTKGKSKPRQLTHLNSELFHSIQLSTPEEIIINGHDNYPIHSWVMKPPGFSPHRRYPSILEIHGGPRVQYGHSFFHEMQLLASRGYVVYYSNPRGGLGYGRAHAEITVNNWGSVDYEDCMSVARHMAKQQYIDSKKMGVTGGSYGGYMTNWIVTHTDLFAAAVTQRSVVNFISFYGSSDIGFALDREIKGAPWTDLDSWWEMSPIKHVANVRTPLLISHSEDDLRCPIEQGEQFYVALKKLGRTVELVRFPEEPHGLSRCGRPDRRIARLNWILYWFDRYLKGKRMAIPEAAAK